MKELVPSITSLGWWFSAVFMAIFINLASAYIKPWLDLQMSRVSETWRNRTAQREEKYYHAVAEAAESPYTLQSLSRKKFATA